MCSHSITAVLQFYDKHQQSLTLGSLSSSSSSGLKASAHTGFGQTKKRGTCISMLCTQRHGLQYLWYLKWVYLSLEKNNQNHLFVGTDFKWPLWLTVLISVLSKYWTSLPDPFVVFCIIFFLSILCLPLSSIMRAVLRWEAHLLSPATRPRCSYCYY